MNESKISVRYSRALFQSALDKNILEKINQDMIFISGICKIDEMNEFLKNPVIVPSRKNEILWSGTAGKAIFLPLPGISSMRLCIIRV
jgi:F0F1-type ATP synthase delta subunit